MAAAGFLQTASESNIFESYRCCAVTANVDTFNLTSCKCRNSLYQMDSISFCTIISDIAYLSPALFMWQSRYSILCTLQLETKVIRMSRRFHNQGEGPY